MSTTTVVCKTNPSTPPLKQSTKLNCGQRIPKCRFTLKKSNKPAVQRDTSSQQSLPSKVKLCQENTSQTTKRIELLKNSPPKYPQLQASKTDFSDAGRRKPSINPDIRRVAPKTDLRQRKSVETPGKPVNGKTPKYVSPYSRTHLLTEVAKPTRNDVKPVEGRRPVLKMPAAIPKASKRKHRYVITVVGSEIKLLDPKNKLQRSDTTKFQLPPVNNCTTVNIRPEKPAVPKRRKKDKEPGKLKKSTDDKCKQPKKNDDVVKSVLKVMQLGNNRATSTSSELDMPIGLNLMDDGKKVVKFSDRRTKMDSTGKVLFLTEDEALLEKLDPISNILNTEYVDSVQKCQAITDFLIEPMDNPNPPFLSKRIFHDSTYMEELNFPPLRSSDFSPDFVELPMVPKFLPDNVKRSLSWPMAALPKLEVRRLPISSLHKKKRPKLETILATRPKGFHLAKWVEKTVASDSQLKTRLLRDVIVSQVKKLLKKQAEQRCKNGEKNPYLGGLDADMRSR